MVALDGDDVIGHIAFSRARLDSGVPVLALGPMGVVPAAQRRGVGSALMRESLRRAAETDYPLVVVVGHPEYYPRFGFERGDAHDIRTSYEVPPEAWMVLRLPAYRSGLDRAGRLSERVRPRVLGEPFSCSPPSAAPSSACGARCRLRTSAATPSTTPTGSGGSTWSRKS